MYSKVLDGGFCKYCALFVKDRDKCSVLVNRPSKKWVKLNKIVGSHATSISHREMPVLLYIQSKSLWKM